MATALPASHSSPIHLAILSNSALLRDGLLTVLHPFLPIALTVSGGGESPIPMARFPAALQLLILDWNVGQPLALSRIRECYRMRLPVVVIELPDHIESLVECIEAGASGYTLRGATANDLALAIMAVVRGEAPCSPQLAAHLFSRLATYHQNQITATRNLLTGRELEVLELLVKEYSNKAIAAALCIEVRTVKHHVHNILDKLQLHSRWEASAYAVQHSLVVSG